MSKSAGSRYASAVRAARAAVALALLVMAWHGLAAGALDRIDGDNQSETFRYGPEGPSKAFEVQQIACTVPGNALFPGERTTITYQVISKIDEPIRASGRALLMTYGTRMYPDDPFKRRFVPGELLGSTPFEVDVAPKGFAEVRVSPEAPETFGPYVIVIEIEGRGRSIGTPLVRIPRPIPGKVQHPAFAIDLNGWNCFPVTYELFKRLGIKAIRQEVGYDPSERTKRWLAEVLKGLGENDITLLITSAAGGPQPMGRTRRFLNDNDEYMDFPLQDMAWLPSSDEDYERWIEYLASTYGWPKGPVNAIELWNEPWEGCSISGWGADMIRYRTLYERMAKGIEAARAKAGVDVLIGGCCSSMNTEDKLFPDGDDRFLKWLDFTSIHYQPMCAWPALIPEWMERDHPKGPVRVWDTESWIANSEDHISAVLAVMRALGQTRTAGVLHGWTYDVIQTDVRMPDGTKTKIPVAVPWANAAAVAANQKLVGERVFNEILFKNGLPWVFIFDGLEKDGAPDPDDRTMVVVGDAGGNTERDRCRFRRVIGLAQVGEVERLEAEIAALPPDATREERERLKRALISAQYLDGASMTIPDGGGAFRAYDWYANPIPAAGGRITIPLNVSGYFLGTDGSAGSFARLVEAVRGADVRGYQPVEIVAHDFTERVRARPPLRLSITNVLNRPIEGKLEAKLGGLSIINPFSSIKIGPHETKEIRVPVAGGRESPSNTYALDVTFDAGADGKVRHREDLHANVIPRARIRVDGDLRDWRRVPPQPFSAAEGLGRNLTEKAWLPMLQFDEKIATGLATAYLAWDDRGFYVAAKIADATPWEGGVRYATRDDDAYFFPAKSYEVRKDGSGKVVERREFVWPEGVRRFSYRRNPDLPSGSGTDNVQIAFGVFEPGKNGLYANPPGTMPRFMAWGCTDYEYAFNPVAARYGGGTEIWRMLAPGTPRKHFYPRQPKAPRDGGPVDGGRLVMKREGKTRIVEASIPWSEMPEVKKRLDAGVKVRFNLRVNDDKGAPYELCGGRSVSQVNTYALHNLWEQSWSTEVEFAFEK